MSNRPFRHLCPEADDRDQMDDGEFWEHVGQSLGFVIDVADDVDQNRLDQIAQLARPCGTCGADGACAYDSEGRALIHADEEPV